MAQGASQVQVSAARLAHQNQLNIYAKYRKYQLLTGPIFATTTRKAVNIEPTAVEIMPKLAKPSTVPNNSINIGFLKH